MRFFKFLLRTTLWLCLLAFIGLNIVLYNHAYYFTHFTDKDIPKITSKDLKTKTTTERLELAFWGVELPKPKLKELPAVKYEEIWLEGEERLHGWWIPREDAAKGVVILCHGYQINKSSQLGRASVYHKLGYHTFLIDFRGHGNSEGTATTIGYQEAEDVRLAYEYIQQRSDLPIVLAGMSMGAVSILRAVSLYNLDAKALILECPFASMRSAIQSRFENVGLPPYILPDLLLLWGSWQHSMNCWSHKTTDYAKTVDLPTLLIYGDADELVRRSEIDQIYGQLQGLKKTIILEDAGHNSLLTTDPNAWTTAIWEFLDRL